MPLKKYSPHFNIALISHQKNIKITFTQFIFIPVSFYTGMNMPSDFFQTLSVRISYIILRFITLEFMIPKFIQNLQPEKT